MTHLSSGESSKPQSPQKAFLMGELAAAKRSTAQKDEEMRQMEERFQRLEATYDKPQRGRGYHPRRESRSYQYYGSHEEEEEWRMQHFDDRCQHVAKPSLPFVKILSFSGEGDPNVYLGWEAKVEQIFNVHEVQEDQKVKLASLEFLDYAMQWWPKTVMDIGLNKRSAVVSWEDLKLCMRLDLCLHTVGKSSC